MLFIYTYVALLSYNVEYLMWPLESVECIEEDDAADITVLDTARRVKRGDSKRSNRSVPSSFGRAGDTATIGAAEQGGMRTWSMSRSKAEKVNWR